MKEEGEFNTPRSYPERRDTNPRDKDGQPYRCHECDSTKHFANKCPHRKQKPTKAVADENEKVVNEVHITLFAANPDQKQYGLIGESFGQGILDSGCTKTVSGELWMQEFINTLSG